MIATGVRNTLLVILGFVLSTGSPWIPWIYQTPASAAQTAEGNPTESAPMSANELESLVAPIALYPDQLVAQVLSAATFPDQVAIADYWLTQHTSLTGNAFAQEVDKQTWDPSVKALTQFPSVLDNMARNLTWTSSLGEAYHNQPAEVMTAVQTLRAKAKAAGNLKSSPQMTVTQQSPQTIVIEPANPQVVYVPQYNPAVIYGTPYVTPGYTAGDVAASGILGFGTGVAAGALASGGWGSWGCNWSGGAVAYNHNNFYGNSAWHGGYYNGGYHAGYGYDNAYNRADAYNRASAADSYRRGSGDFNRNVSGNTFNLNRQAATSWAHDSGAGRTSAFSGLDGHSGRFGNFGGWSSRAESGRGWGSMRAGGFHGFGGGGFRGGRR